MAIILTEKYAAQVDELLGLETQTAPLAKTDGYSWDGAQTVYIKSVGTTPLNDYGRGTAGLGRYGAVADLEVTKKPYTLTQDKSFTFGIDKMDSEETQVLEAESALARQIKYEVIPEIDSYRIGKLIIGAGLSATETVTDVKKSLLAARTALTNEKVPVTGRIAYVKSSLVELLIGNLELQAAVGESANVNGVIGRMAGFDLIEVPDEFLGAAVNFVALHTMAVVSPVKLAEYKIHTDPVGYSGVIVEGRIYHDCFLLENKKKAVFKSVVTP
ncbi:MAG: hypothetical protein ACRCU6_12445 [Fusobacteriaceae bacterium]